MRLALPPTECRYTAFRKLAFYYSTVRRNAIKVNQDSTVTSCFLFRYSLLRAIAGTKHRRSTNCIHQLKRGTKFLSCDSHAHTCEDSEIFMPAILPVSTKCVQKFHDSLRSVVLITDMAEWDDGFRCIFVTIQLLQKGMKTGSTLCPRMRLSGVSNFRICSQ